MKRYFCLLIFSLSFTTSFSQENVVELSHYLFPEFTQGVVLMKTGIENKALLNYNSLTEEMVFDDKDKILAIGQTELNQVDTVYIKGRKFITLNNKFIELICHSKFDLYIEYKCEIIPPGTPAAYGGTSYTSATTSYSSLNSGGVLYKLKLPDGYKTKPYHNYWLKKNGEWNKFINMKQLLKLYDDKEDIFKDYVKKNDIKYDNKESIVQLIKYLETN